MRIAALVLTLSCMAHVVGAQQAPPPALPPAPPAQAKFPTPPAAPLPPSAADFAERWAAQALPAGQSIYAPDVARVYSQATAPIAMHFDGQVWTQADPADSLYRVAYESMNRGDWRRAADLFQQLQEKYPRSSRLASAAYYEAFNNYRIGSVESLRTALRILERTKGGDSNRQAEIASLTTRVRGALAARGDQAAQRALASEANRGQSCDREDIAVRTEALSALASADMASATPMLTRVLARRDECSLELRRRALSILLRRADTAATNAAIQVARSNDENIAMRTDAISYLSRLPGENAIAALQELLRTSDDASIQRAAVRSLARSDNSRARQAVRAVIERTDVAEALRAEAISAFDVDRGSAEDGAYLRGIYPRLGSERLKNAAVNAMGRIGGEENERFLLQLLRNSNESSEVRANAISRLSKNTSISIQEWQRVYDAAESRSIRSRIIGVYAQRQEPEAVDRLIEIVDKGTDLSLRNSAIQALRVKDDARARKHLQDLIDRVDR